MVAQGREGLKVDHAWPGSRELGRVLLLYLACLAVAIAPLLAHLHDHLPCLSGDLADPLQHLWIMRWYKACAFEGRSPVLSPEVQYPIGAAIGNYSPLHLQSLLFAPFSLATSNDVLSFNLVWCLGLLSTGIGTHILARRVVGSPPAAAVAGALVMLGAPVMIHARATHLELVFLGSIPLFLAVWTRFVDAPTRRWLMLAVASYWLVALSAAYYSVFAAVAASLYVLMWPLGTLRGQERGRIRRHLVWIAAFGAIALIGLLGIFGNQIWALRHGFALERPADDLYGTPIWTYAVPTAWHRLSGMLSVDHYAEAGYAASDGEHPSYLGIVTLAFLAYALLLRVRFPRAIYWWSLLAVLVICSMGGYLVVDSHPYPLPARWVKAHVPGFGFIRVFARFNQVVGVVAALIAAAGIGNLLGRLPTSRWRWGAVVVILGVALVDLVPTGFPRSPLPPIPTTYGKLTSSDPRATLVEVPQFNSDGGKLNAACGYWQSIHGMPTTAGYSGQRNVRYDLRMVLASPFFAAYLANPAFPVDENSIDIGAVQGVGYLDYVWLYLHAHDLRYVVLHRWEGSLEDFPMLHVERLQSLLEPARLLEDEATVVYARDRLPEPARPAILCTEGWGAMDFKASPRFRTARQLAKLALFNPPDEEGEIRLTIDAQAFQRRRSVSLRHQGRELARWDVEPWIFQTLDTGPLILPERIQELQLVSDGQDVPVARAQVPDAADMRAFSLRVSRISIEAVERPSRVGGR